MVASPVHRGLRHFRSCNRDRFRALPEPYRSTIDSLERYLIVTGGISDGDSAASLLEDLADLFEQAAAEQTPIRSIVGDDPVEFIETFLRNYPEGDWRAKERQRLTQAIAAAAGVELRKGPRGGGRELEAISRHVLGAEQGYLSRLAWKAPKSSDENLNEEMRVVRQAIMDALAAAVRGEIPERGPRGGVIWPARYFIRRVAWHVLDHAWEIEDRAQ